MKYKKIILRNFRGISSHELPLGDGVTVVAGPNEVGKSSIREAIDMLRRYKDSSRASAVKNVAPIGKDVAPYVELQLDTGPYDITYRKQWLRRPLTELEVIHNGIPSHYIGDEAHEKFEELLKSTVDINLLAQADVAQGESLVQPKLAEVTALHQALGASPDTAEADVLLARVEEEFLRYFTRGGRESTTLRRLDEQVAELEQSLFEASHRFEEANDFARELADNDERLERLDATLQEDRKRLNAAEEEHKKLDLLIHTRDEAAQDAEQAKKKRDFWRGSLDEFRKTKQDLADAEAELLEAQESLSSESAALEDVRSGLQEAELLAQNAEDRVRELQEERQVAQEALDRNRDLAELRTITTQINRVEAVQVELAAAQGELASTTTDDEALAQIMKAERELAIAEVAWRTSASSVTVEPVNSAEVTVQIGADETVIAREGSTFEVLRPVTITVQDVITVFVQPGASPSDLEGTAQVAAERLSECLADVDQTSIESAQEDNVRRRLAERNVQRSHEVLQELLAGKTLEDLRGERSRLALATGVSDDTQTNEDDAPGRGERTALEAALTDLRQQEGALREQWDDRKENLHVLQSKEQSALQAHRLQQERSTELRVRVKVLAQQVDILGREHSEEQLKENIEGCDKQVTVAEEKARQVDGQIAALHPEELEMRLENLRESIPTKEERRKSMRSRSVELSTLVKDRSEEGLFDKVQDLEAQREAVTAQRDRMRARANAVDLLRKTLLTHKKQAQEQYVRPFEEGINKLGRVLFGPTFAVHIDSDLQMLGRTLDGLRVPFDSLSVGTKEQLSILGRLVCAQLVDPSVGAPLILDDTLGYADKDRLLALNAVLNHVGDDTQIIVLTCQVERFENVGRAEIVYLPGRGAAAQP